MVWQWLIWLYTTLYKLVSTDALSTEMLHQYFNLKSINIVTLFACSTNDYINLFQKIMSDHRQVAFGANYLDENSTFTHRMHSPYYKMGVYLDYTCDFGKEVLLQSSNSFILNSSYVWIIKINSSDSLNKFENFNFGLDSDVIIAVDSDEYTDGNNNRSINLVDLYKVNSTWPLISTLAGSYNYKTGFNITLNGSLIQRRHDFRGITFNGTIVIIDMNVNEAMKILNTDFLDPTKNSEYDALSRCVYVYCTYLMEIYNFSLEVQATPIFGYPVRKEPKPTHSGMIGQLENREIDVGLSPATMMITSRLDVTHFTALTTWLLRASFIFCHPSTLGTYKALIIPFSTQVWVFILCLTLSVGIILTFIKNVSITNPVDTDKSLSGNIIVAIGALYQQGLSSCSNQVPERIVLLSTLIIGVITVTYYNSMIVTSLLQPPPKSIRTPKRLVESTFKLALQNHSYLIHFFEKSPDRIIQRMLKKIKQGHGIMKPMEAVSLVQKSGLAFYSERPAVYRLIEATFSNEEICSLQEIELEKPVQMQIPLRRNSPLLKYFNCAIILMRETGIMYAMNKKWRPRKPECQGNTSIPSVQLQSVLIAYMVLIIGIVSSLMVLGCEILLHKYKIKRRIKKLKIKFANKIEILRNY